jgi:pre-mRNA-splicing helicase BRR2
VYDLMEMEDDKRNEILKMDSRQMWVPSLAFPSCLLTIMLIRRDVATFVNSYPTLDVTQQLEKADYTSSTPVTLQVSLSRDADEEDEEDDQTVVAPFYPMKKMANWWLVVGDVTDPTNRQLLTIKRVTVKRELNVKLEFTLSEGRRRVKLYVICDSYNGADHDVDLGTLDVAKGEDSDSDDESGSDEMDVS